MARKHSQAVPNPRALNRRFLSAGPLEVRPSPLRLQRVTGLIVSPLRTESLAVRAAGSRNEAETP